MTITISTKGRGGAGWQSVAEGSRMDAGDRVRNIYTNKEGTILDVWDGKYTVSYYDGEQYNPYRITVELDHSAGEAPSGYIYNFKAEHLEII